MTDEEAKEVEPVATPESVGESTSPDLPEIMWIRVQDAQKMLWGANPNDHDLPEVIESFERHGVQELPKLDKNIGIKAGNGRTTALGLMERDGMDMPRGLQVNEHGEWLMPIIVGVDARDKAEAMAYALDSNNIGLTNMTAAEKAAQWESAAYLEILKELAESDALPVSVEGSDFESLLALAGEDYGEAGSGGGSGRGIEDPGLDDMPVPEELQKKWQVKPGDVWGLGEHKLACADCTDEQVLAVLFGERRAILIHADPPYGMGKEKDGVINDNLYNQKLDDFQSAWWKAMRAFSTDKASVYVWGNAEDLWRWWFTGWEGEAGRMGIGETEKMMIRNEIVWDKKSIAGMKSHLLTQYPIASERCLFIQIGQQFLGNVNTEDYWDGWDKIRVPLKDEADKAGVTPTLLKEVLGVSMYSHWFSKSQWCLMPPVHYYALQEHFPGFFLRPYTEIRYDYDKIKQGFRNHFNEIQGGMRSMFDNAHDVMRDVWEFARVHGEERMGHATPKPVDMMERVIKSSSEPGNVMFVPFGGTGPEWIAAENLGRICYGTELSPEYCSVILERWSVATGKEPVRIEV